MSEQEDQWSENMEYLEAYDDAALDMAEEDAEAINEKLDIIDRDRMARENGEKPAIEWTRPDFKDLLHDYPPLRGLRTYELQAAFLICEETIDGVSYYKRRSLEFLRRWRARSVPVYRLLVLPNRWFFERWRMENRQLWRLWQNLGENKGEKE